ncbi:hypothetical protein GCM10011500_36540 [Mucilaginibacter rubeus]|nr:hypothetical protein GCM10011500_36540 [Mucilaginibacter rubeus]
MTSPGFKVCCADVEKKQADKRITNSFFMTGTDFIPAKMKSVKIKLCYRAS